jgi:hypothetical protein
MGGKAKPGASRRWRKAHPEQWKASRDKWAKANPEKIQARNRRAGLKRLGITTEDYDRMMVEQNGVCAICRKPESAKGPSGQIKLLAIDHDHVTNRVRGLLCQKCNHGIGQLKDDPLLLRAAADYLEKRS